MKFNGTLSIVFAASLSAFLSACGGGSSSSVSSTTNNSSSTTNNSSTVNIQAPSVVALPRVINPINWKNSHLLNSQSNTDLNIEVVGTELLINIESDNLSVGNHVQIYLDTDNNAGTGFQFENQAWSKSGVDYIIEDGYIFKSTASDTTWSWNNDISDISYGVRLDELNISIDLSLLGDICNSINVGVITRDNDWDIATFYPISARMQSFKVSYCSTTPDDTEAPVLTLTGANPLNLEVGSIYSELGATAIDNLDGDINANILITSNVNTSIAGNYTVNYEIIDNALNRATSIRTVIVTEATPEGITVDGNGSDWATIPALVSSSNGIMKVTDDAKKIYILINAENLNENTQIFMDTDNQASTGLDLASHINTWNAGADYILENNSLDKSTSNSPQWSWNYGIADIEFAKVGNILEAAIKKSDFEYLGNKIPMAFISSDENWNIQYQIPVQAMPVYSLQFPANSDQVSANNDNVTVANSGTINIDVLANDISYSGSALKILALQAGPDHGNASIESNKIKYVADTGFTGIDTITYTIIDVATGQHQDVAVVTIEVSAPNNNAPIANDDSASTVQNTQIAVDVLDNDSDADNDNLTITIIDPPVNGQVVVSANNTIYTPNTDFIGSDTLTYKISDGNGGTDTAKVTITVTQAPNNAPDAVEDVAAVDFDKTVLVDVLANDTDPDGDTLSVQSIVQPSVGTAVLNNDGTILVDPDGNIGSISVLYTVTDGRGGTDSATLTIASTDPNDGNDAYPDITNEVVTTPKNTPIFIDVLANDSDADGDVLVLDQVDQGENGTTSKVNGGVLYTPNPGFTGTDIFYYGVHDGHGHNGSGNVTITITQ